MTKGQRWHFLQRAKVDKIPRLSGGALLAVFSLLPIPTRSGFQFVTLGSQVSRVSRRRGPARSSYCGRDGNVGRDVGRTIWGKGKLNLYPVLIGILGRVFARVFFGRLSDRTAAGYAGLAYDQPAAKDAHGLGL
jgi:hypothetical protein